MVNGHNRVRIYTWGELWIVLRIFSVKNLPVAIKGKFGACAGLGEFNSQAELRIFKFKTLAPETGGNREK